MNQTETPRSVCKPQGDYGKILAKSRDEISLVEHTKNVVQGCEVFFDLAGPDMLKMYRVETPPEVVRRLLRAAAIFHDVGKANDHFQAMIRTGEAAQAFRHETMSYVFLRHAPIREWLASALEPWEFEVVCWVVAGHHRKFPPSRPEEHPTGRMTLLCGHDEVAGILDMAGRLLDLPRPPLLQGVVYDVATISDRCFRCLSGSPCGACLPNVMDVLVDARGAVRPPVDHALVACLKSFLIMGDVYGSIKDRTPDDVARETSALLSRRFGVEMSDEIVRRKRTDGRGEVLWELNDLQETIADSTSRVTLVDSGCGGGKTITGYRWGRRHADGRKLYFCYPTMGTSTAGYFDYLADFEAWLVHSTARIELQTADKDPFSGSELADTFRVLGHPVVSCTADTVLGLLQNYHLGILGCAGFAVGAFVFDEIHSYDAKMWKALLRFIQFDVPCLLMTASLPGRRLDELREAVSAVGDVLHEPESRGKSESTPRHRLDSSIDDPWGVATRTLERGGRVLWISNTVDECIRLFERAASSGMDAYCYHSRFKAADRLRAHHGVIDAFRSGSGPRIAFTTQVAEMSFDISADVLVTDPAPVSALIQRLGRLNRYLDSRWAECYVLRESYHPNGEMRHAPYERHEIDEALRWIEALPGWPVLSQDDLVGAWRAIDVRDTVADSDTLKHVDGLMETEVGSLRKTDGVNLEIVLPDDASGVESGALRLHDVKIRVHVYKDSQYADWKPFRDHTYVPPVGVFDYEARRGLKWNR